MAALSMLSTNTCTVAVTSVHRPRSSVVHDSTFATVGAAMRPALFGADVSFIVARMSASAAVKPSTLLACWMSSSGTASRHRCINRSGSTLVRSRRMPWMTSVTLPYAARMRARAVSSSCVGRFSWSTSHQQ